MGVAETFWAEIYGRLTALPTFGADIAMVRRTHRTDVPREKSPAVYLFEGESKRVGGDRSACTWDWETRGRIEVINRSDVGTLMAEPMVLEVLARISPERSDIPVYSNNVRLELERVDAEAAVADVDAAKVSIEFVAKYKTARWSLNAPT